MNMLRESLQRRLSLAVEAFRRAQKSVGSLAAPKNFDPQPILGWLYPVDRHPMSYALRPGTQFLILGKRGEIHTDESRSDSAVTLDASVDRIQTPDRTIFHGEEITLGPQKFRLALLPARALNQAVKLLLFTILVGSVSVHKASAETSGEVRAGFREEFTLHVPILGANRLEVRKVHARVTSNGESLPLKVLEVLPANTHYLVLYDGSVLCTARKMESLLNQEISDLLQNLDPAAHFTLVRYDQNPGVRGADQFNYDRVFPVGTRVAAAQASGALVSCNPQTLSVNGLEAVTEIAPQVFRDPSERKVVILFSPGHVTELAPQILESLRKVGIDDLRAVVFSPVESDSIKAAIAPLSDVASLIWWTKPEPLHIASLLNYAWNIDLRADLPTRVAEGQYRLNLGVDREGKPLSFSYRLNYSLNKGNLFWYRLWSTVVGLLLLSLTTYLAYRIYSYYRVPRCHVDGMVMSRAWNRCLFCAAGKDAVLLVKNADAELQCAHVLHESVTRVGGRFADHLRLKRVRRTESLKFSRLLPDVYRLSSDNGHGFALNGRWQTTPINLKRGDMIQFGSYQIQFLSSPQPERSL